jgi:hypothetical protein
VVLERCQLSPVVFFRSHNAVPNSPLFPPLIRTPSLPSAMARGVTIPNSMRETVVRMSAAFGPEEIRTYTDVSERQQSRILKLWKETGSSIPAPDTIAPRGRPRHLSAEEVFVSDSRNPSSLSENKSAIVPPQLRESYM